MLKSTNIKCVIIAYLAKEKAVKNKASITLALLKLTTHDLHMTFIYLFMTKSNHEMPNLDWSLINSTNSSLV